MAAKTGINPSYTASIKESSNADFSKSSPSNAFKGDVSPTYTNPVFQLSPTSAEPKGSMQNSRSYVAIGITSPTGMLG